MNPVPNCLLLCLGAGDKEDAEEHEEYVGGEDEGTWSDWLSALGPEEGVSIVLKAVEEAWWCSSIYSFFEVARRIRIKRSTKEVTIIHVGK